jgi:hypothetical protein
MISSIQRHLGAGHGTAKILRCDVVLLNLTRKVWILLLSGPHEVVNARRSSSSNRNPDCLRFRPFDGAFRHVVGLADQAVLELTQGAERVVEARLEQFTPLPGRRLARGGPFR